MPLSICSDLSLIPLPRSAVHLWIIDTNAVKTANLSATYLTVLDNAERQRALLARSAARRQQFLVARASLRLILSAYLPNCTPDAIRFKHNAHGKPFLADNPFNLQFNLSHSNDKVLIGVTCLRPLGVDIEYMKHKRDVKKIADAYFHPSEWHAELASKKHSDSALQKRFYQIWTLKEAFIKAEGKGLFLPIGEFYFCEDKNHSFQLNVSAPDCQPTRQWLFEQRFLSQGYSVALATEKMYDNTSAETVIIPHLPLSDALPDFILND